MTRRTSVQDAVDELARDPLRQIVLLKHLLAYPEHVRVHRVADATGAATLVLLDAAASAYDRETFRGRRLPLSSRASIRRLPRRCSLMFRAASGSSSDR